ncbi:hypothetical protein [Fictibacillus sp. KU28468]|uniref:hypothetical protein n=1 Tax=Fictibacillus sp. KU28468 TaxID=2991053 RepID=UPI00223E6A44|nr:hypothetical protein [Fictibacillus sp. KU28468]UZJ80246.1 hypothetical protein OKX00_07220 [Fictibacillus sp. KU28468]
MAQLVKLEDYVSRYELNLYHYQSRFVALKKRRAEEGKNQRTSISRKIFTSQLKWASSTVKEFSKLDPCYLNDEQLQFLTTKIPDSYFLFYKPAILHKAAPVELEVILAGPGAIWCIVLLEGKDAIYHEDTKHFWKRTDDGQKSKKVVNPFIALERMDFVLKPYLEPFKDRLHLKKAVLCQNGYVDIPPKWSDVQVVDKRTFGSWYTKVAGDPSPPKSHQLKFIDALLKASVTNSLLQPEWEGNSRLEE